MRFVDVFAGLGGFHLALRKLGHECVFASEIDEGLCNLYERNFGMRPKGDIRSVREKDIPAHDILCAGFPCQPFSKAGDQQGFGCTKWGGLFDEVLRILKHRRPSYFILENVPNILKHNGGATWRGIEARLRRRGYDVSQERLSPHRFGIPQVRERVFIVGSREGLNGFSWPEQDSQAKCSISTVLDPNPSDARHLSDQVVKCLEVWQDFLSRFPKDEQLPSFPIWSMEFGATYPYKETTPYALGVQRLRGYRGSHGRLLSRLSESEVMQALPSHARRQDVRFPDWKIDFIRHNRELYERHRKWIDKWLPSVTGFASSLQKFEWNCKSEPRDLWKMVIQFRASGVRIKRPNTAPSLVAMTSTQVPIIGPERRYMTPRECARLQSMEELPHLPASLTAAYQALGNAVNVALVEAIASVLLNADGPAHHRGRTIRLPFDRAAAG